MKSFGSRKASGPDGFKPGVSKLLSRRATCGEMNICGGPGVSKKCTHSYMRQSLYISK